MIRYLHNINPYVENNAAYHSDSVKLELDEGTNTVTCYPVDTSGDILSGSSPIVTKTLTSLDAAVEYYEEIAHQLTQGDIIRNI